METDGRTRQKIIKSDKKIRNICIAIVGKLCYNEGKGKCQQKEGRDVHKYLSFLLSIILHGRLQSAGIFVNVRYMVVEGRPVNQGNFHYGVLKQIRPLRKRQVYGQNGASFSLQSK